FVGINLSRGLLTKNLLYRSFDDGRTGLTSDENHFVNITGLQVRIAQRAFTGLYGLIDQIRYQPFELVAAQGLVQMLWPRGICVNERQIETGLSRGRELALGALSGFLQTLQGEPVFPQINSRVLHELVSHPIHNAFVKIFAPKKSVARS